MVRVPAVRDIAVGDNDARLDDISYKRICMNALRHGTGSPVTTIPDYARAARASAMITCQPSLPWLPSTAAQRMGRTRRTHPAPQNLNDPVDLPGPDRDPERQVEWQNATMATAPRRLYRVAQSRAKKLVHVPSEATVELADPFVEVPG